MKTKFLSIAFAFVVALALCSCGGGAKDAVKDAKPTGDPAKDAKAYVEKIIYLAEGINSDEDYEKVGNQLQVLENEFKKAYKDDEYAKFKDEVNNLVKGEYKDKLEPLQDKLSKIKL